LFYIHTPELLLETFNKKMSLSGRKRPGRKRICTALLAFDQFPPQNSGYCCVLVKKLKSDAF